MDSINFWVCVPYAGEICFRYKGCVYELTAVKISKTVLFDFAYFLNEGLQTTVRRLDAPPYTFIRPAKTVNIFNQTKCIYCKISSSHGGEYDVQSCLLGYTAV
jgi:hypothetical protein